MGEGAQLASPNWGPGAFLLCRNGGREQMGQKIDVRGGSSQALTGEIGLSEIQNVFAEVSICPGKVELLQK